MLGTMALSAAGGALTKGFGMWMQYKQENHKQTIALLAQKELSVVSARDDQTPGTLFARRFIVIMSFCMLAFLVVAPAFLPIVTNVPIESWIPWIDWEYTQLKGLVAYEVLMEILVATTSFYMGSATISR